MREIIKKNITLTRHKSWGVFNADERRQTRDMAQCGQSQ